MKHSLLIAGIAALIAFGASADEPSVKRDDALYRKLTGQAAAESPPPNLRDVAGRMEIVGKQLAPDRLGPNTHKLQQSIVDDLQKLIEAAAKQNRQPNGNPQPGQHTKPSPKNGGDPQETRNSVPSRDNGSKTGQPDKGAESDPGTRKPTDDPRVRLAARRQRLLDEVWGHLPEQIRDRIRNVNSEKFLSEYDDLLKQYFQAISR